MVWTLLGLFQSKGGGGGPEEPRRVWVVGRWCPPFQILLCDGPMHPPGLLCAKIVRCGGGLAIEEPFVDDIIEQALEAMKAERAKGHHARQPSPPGSDFQFFVVCAPETPLPGFAASEQLARLTRRVFGEACAVPVLRSEYIVDVVGNEDTPKQVRPGWVPLTVLEERVRWGKCVCVW